MLDNRKALECRILAKLFAATVCPADGREIFGNRGESFSTVLLCVRFSLSLSSLVHFFFLWLPKFRVLFKFLNIHILNDFYFILFIYCILAIAYTQTHLYFLFFSCEGK
jgi:hypothetical protein